MNRSSCDWMSSAFEPPAKRSNGCQVSMPAFIQAITAMFFLLAVDGAPRVVPVLLFGPFHPCQFAEHRKFGGIGTGNQRSCLSSGNARSSAVGRPA